jgi:drug/metabolite transporter (DMT)-like permease
MFRYNYPTFLNIFGNLLFVVVCFCYIIPVSYFGWLNNAIPSELWALPKRPFMIMGSLDSLATTMQVFASVYLPGPLMVLLMQATIPISMIMSRLILGEKYRPRQYLGALIVMVGIFVVLEPVMTQRRDPEFVCEAIHIDDYCTVCQVEKKREPCLSHKLDDERSPAFLDWNWTSSGQMGWNSSGTNTTMADDDGDREGIPVCRWISTEDSSTHEDAMLMLVWSFLTIASCFPTTVSSIYKQITFTNHPNMDPIFLNGWVSLFQLFFSACLVVPSGMATTPTVLPIDVPEHLWR